MIDQDLIAYVVALGTEAQDRVRLGNAHQGDTFPVVVIRRSGGSKPATLGGRTLFERSQFAFHILTNEYATAYPIAQSILDRLHGTRSTPGLVGMVGSTSIKYCRCIRFPTDESEIDGDKVVRWVQMEFQFMHSEG